MTWIKTISYKEAEGRLKKIYEQVKSPGDIIDNIIVAHSLRPHTAEGHISVFKNIMHHSGNNIDVWFLEAMGLYVSLINECEYCISHHNQEMVRLVNDDTRSAKLRAALEAGNLPEMYDAKQIAAMEYCKALTVKPISVTEADINKLRDAGWDDGEILEINQVACYYAFANRMTIGLGITTEGEAHGGSPLLRGAEE